MVLTDSLEKNRITEYI